MDPTQCDIQALFDRARAITGRWGRRRRGDDDGNQTPEPEHFVQNEETRFFFREASILRMFFPYHDGKLEDYMQYNKNRVIRMLNR